jgi:hypothetical protein
MRLPLALMMLVVVVNVSGRSPIAAAHVKVTPLFPVMVGPPEATTSPGTRFDSASSAAWIVARFASAAIGVVVCPW